MNNYDDNDDLNDNIIAQKLSNKVKIDICDKEEEKVNLDLKIPNYIFKTNSTCQLLVIDNFYSNPLEIRNFILQQEFKVRGNFPGKRTIAFANEEHKNIIQKYLQPLGGNIIDFPLYNPNKPNELVYNGSFQYTTSYDRSWIHCDGFNTWAGVLYLTPNAPISSGTTFYKFYDGTEYESKTNLEINKCTQDLTKWETVDFIGNKFNRLVLFNSKRYHMSKEYFGNTLENSRLFQVFFFTTDK
jgi:hypothetical protein